MDDPSTIVSWAHEHGAYMASTLDWGGPELSALGSSAEEALFNLKEKIKEAKKISEAWKDE